MNPGQLEQKNYKKIIIRNELVTIYCLLSAASFQIQEPKTKQNNKKNLTNLNQGTPTLCATNTITPILNVICQRLSRERWFLCVDSKTHFFAYVISRKWNTNQWKKKYWTMFYNRITVRMQQFGQIRAKLKNDLKFNIGRLCSQPFNNNA